MTAKKEVHINVFMIGVMVLVLICSGRPVLLHGELFLQELTEDQKQAIKEEIQEAIQEAQKLSDEEKYADALRLLFDAMYQEYKLFPEQASPSARSELTKLEQSLLHEDPSPLMEFFRDLDVPLEEKLDVLKQLREFVAHDGQLEEEELFRGTYGGILVQLLKSPKLDQGEKFDVLHWIDGTIRAEYTLMAQWEQMKEEIIDLRRDAEQKFQAHQYVEAFVLIDEATHKAQDCPLDVLTREGKTALYEQRVHMVTVFLQSGESPLMKRLKSRLISYRKKKQLLNELEEILRKDVTKMPDKIIFQGKEYDGPLLQILRHSKVHWLTKFNILEHMKTLIKKYSLIP